MNTESHRLFAEKLNKAYGFGFPLKALREGAADPDDKVKERYDGDEHLHHFNPSRKPVSVAGNVVWRRVKAARSCWLTGDKELAAHHFGVATHFLTDAFIVSPGIDEHAHYLGDAKFGAAVRGLSPNKIGFPNLGGAGFAEKALSTTMPLFGCNKASNIRAAFEAAAKMGFCVTEPSVPRELSRWGTGAVKALENQLVSSSQSFAGRVRALAEKHAARARKAAADVSGASRFFQHALAVDEAYARMGERNPSLVARLGCRLYIRSVSKRVLTKEFRDSLTSKKKRVLGTAQGASGDLDRELRKAADDWRPHDGWFRIGETVHAWQSQTRRIASQHRSELQKAIEQGEESVREEIVRATDPQRALALHQMPGWWFQSTRMRIGRFGADLDRALWPASFCTFLIPCLLLALVLFPFWGWPAVGLISILWLSASFAWARALKHWMLLSHFASEAVEGECPACGKTVWIWVGLLDGSGNCPHCGNRFVMQEGLGPTDPDRPGSSQ